MQEIPAVLNQDELTALCAEWQKRLRLQDWCIVVKISRGRDMACRNRAGEITYCHSHKTGVIAVLHPHDHADFALEGEFPADMEKTLVHELLELHFSRFKKEDGDKYIAQEVAINLIAEALVTLKRESRPDHDAECYYGIVAEGSSR